MKKILTTFSLILFSSTAFAEWASYITAWDTDDGTTFTLVVNEQNNSKIIAASISHSVSGEKNLYIQLKSGNKKNECRPNEKIPEIAKFDGQAVKLISWCKKLSDSEGYFLEFTPRSDRGTAYVLKRFRQAGEFVVFQYSGLTAKISAVGFIRSWRGAGSDAL